VACATHPPPSCQQMARLVKRVFRKRDHHVPVGGSIMRPLRDSSGFGWDLFRAHALSQSANSRYGFRVGYPRSCQGALNIG
jgi:hypothetical protein